jgi:hypothetical protein
MAGDAVLGTPRFSPRAKQIVMAELGLDVKTVKGFSDTDLLRQVIDKGILDPETIKHTADIQQFVRQLIVNDAVPAELTNIMVMPMKDGAIGLRFMTTNQIEKLHPVIMPFTQNH